MLDSALQHVTLIATILAIGGFLYLAVRLFGTRGLFAAIGALSLLLLYRKGRTDGSSTHIEKERANADHAVREADEARADARVRDAGERLRDDDGHKRPS